MSEWNQVVLDDVSSKIGDGLHGTPTYDDKGLYSFINGNNLLNGRIVIKPETKRITEEEYLKIVKPLDDSTILISINGTIGNVAKYRDELCALGKSACYINLDTNLVDRDFFYYECLSDNFQSHLENVATGTTIPNVPLKGIRAYKFNLPSLPEQKAIASVLSSLDDKIDLLHHQNKTLEAMAETLFRQWFIEEAREDWEDATFEKWISETKGGDWGKEIPIDDFTLEVQCIRGTDIADLQSGLPKSTPIRYVKAKKFESIKPYEGDIVLEISGGTETQSTGRAYYINGQVRRLFTKPLVFSNFCRLLKVRSPKFSKFVYLYLQYLYKSDEFFALENGSSGIKNLNYKVLLTEQFYKMPSTDLVESFDNEVDSFFSKVNANKQQIQTLENLRDTLLPKLMSGEVRVQYQTEEVA